MTNRPLLASIAAATLGAAVPAQAAVVYSNNFDAENGGATALDYFAFQGLTVTYPAVDLLHTNDGYKVACAGGTGGCVDLDGNNPFYDPTDPTSGGPGLAGQLATLRYSFNAGDQVTMSFAISGSQRAASPLDETAFIFRFDQQTTGFTRFTSTDGNDLSGDFDTVENSNVPGAFDLGISVAAPYDYGFRNVSFSFVAQNSGTFRFLFDEYTPGAGDYDDDDAGRVIDNISLDVSAVPEPSAWATMILGMAMIGGVLRQRRRQHVVLG